MKNKVVIKPIQAAHSDIVLSTSYNISGKYRYLQDEDTYAEMTFQQVAEKKSNPSKIKDITFNNMRHEYVVEYETKLEDGKMVAATTLDRERQKMVEVFWKEHPLIVANGDSTKTKSALFNLVDEVKKDAQDVSNFEMKFKVAQTIHDMDFEEKIDCAYYYGSNPSGKTDGQLLVYLADFNTGVCMTPKNVTGFMTTWGAEGTLERSYVINAQKAVTQGIITNMSQDEKDNFYHGTTFIGTSHNDIVAYFKREDRIYKDHILKSLEKDLSKEKKESESFTKKVKGEGAGELNVAEIEELRKEAKKLKDEGFIDRTFGHHIAKVENLIAKVEAGRLAKKEADEVNA